VFCAFATIALLPSTGLGSVVLGAFHRAADRAVRPMAWAIEQARTTVETRVDRALRPRALWHEEEN
jgi:hypothetical protein